ncbi:MAG: GNAT family N-acetyltransferase [Rhodospirillales bacterium]|nr:GNAT family N-acetyltransferase [Rhodospirillales bacterium]
MPSHANKLAQLHLATLPASLPAQLGMRYLVRFYQSVEGSRDEIILSEMQQNELVGGLLLSFAPETLSRRIVFNTILAFAPAFAVRFLTIAKFRQQFIEAIIYGSHEPEPEIAYLFVAPSQQGKGIGRRLVQSAIDIAKARNYRKIYVKSLADNSDGAKLFYTALGFQKTKVGKGGSTEFISYSRNFDD